jgi:hypothetical protein
MTFTHSLALTHDFMRNSHLPDITFHRPSARVRPAPPSSPPCATTRTPDCWAPPVVACSVSEVAWAVVA